MKQANIITRGPSGRRGKEQPGVKIGINDVNAYYPDNYDYTFTVDSPGRFTADRQNTIINSPGLFVCREDNWSPRRKADIRYHIRSGRFYLTPVAGPFNLHYFKSIISPYIAVQFAYYSGFQKIVLCGVDLVDHPLINQPHQLGRIQKDFHRLQIELLKNGASMWLAEKTGILQDIIPVQL